MISTEISNWNKKKSDGGELTSHLKRHESKALCGGITRVWLSVAFATPKQL